MLTAFLSIACPRCGRRMPALSARDRCGACGKPRDVGGTGGMLLAAAVATCSIALAIALLA